MLLELSDATLGDLLGLLGILILTPFILIAALVLLLKGITGSFSKRKPDKKKLNSNK